MKVLKAKELLASGAARNISDAAKQVDISRSAFYKYKDSVFDAENSNEVITVLATLLDETGALQSLLAGISEAGGSVVTISQSKPENGAAQVEVSVRTGTMQMSVDEMLNRLSRQRTIVEVYRGVQGRQNLWPYHTIPALRLKHRCRGCEAQSALQKCSIIHKVLSALFA